MADTFFGFNTALTGSLEDDLHDEPGQGLDEEEEEEYDALNDETFGTDAVEGDWEEDHEKLAEITEQSRIHRNSYNNDSHIESDDHADLELEASISHLGLDDYDDPILENGETSKPEPLISKRFNSGSSAGVDLIESANYSSSAPSGYSVWGVVKPENQQKTTTQSILNVKNVCTVEELERDLISQRTAAPIAPPSGVVKSSSALRLEDVERDISTSSSSVGTTSNFPVVTLGLGRGQSQSSPFVHQDVLLRNSQNAAPVASLGRGSGVAHFAIPQTPQLPQTILALGRGGNAGNAPFGQVVLPTRVLGPHATIAIPDLRQIQQQNHRLMGSAPNLLRFIPPHLMMQSHAGTKSVGPQGFPTENGILHPIHQHRNMAYRHGFQGALVDQHRMPVPGQFPLRPDQVIASHFINNRNVGGLYNQHHGHRGNFNSYYNSYNNQRHPHHHAENGSGDHDDYAGLMTNREKQWLLNIQLLQLNTSQPYVEDYYYTVFNSRNPKKNSLNMQGDIQDSLGRRERRDSYKDRDQHHVTSRDYTPAQFENSLGKLQISNSILPKKNNNNRQNDVHETFGQRERRDSHREREQQQGASRVYTPQQFENSLGKLQVGSVTAPRKIIDMDVVSPEGLEATLQSLQRDSRKAKQLLLEIERLYLLLLQIEDLTSSIPEVQESVTEDKSDLLHKIITSLLVEEKFTSFMCVHKGKLLLLRALPHLMEERNEEESHLLQIWCAIFRGLIAIGKRDQASDESLLPRFYPYLKKWLSDIKFPAILKLVYSLIPESRDSSTNTLPVTSTLPAKNVLAYALGNKFGVSSLVAMVECAESLYLTLEEKQCHEWSNFISTLMEVVGTLPSPESLPIPLEPMDVELLNLHLGRCGSFHIEKYAILERAFTGHQKGELGNKENKKIS